MLELGADGVRCVVDEGAGGRLASLVVDGLELLVGRDDPGAAGDPLRWGCYPMAPFAGRLRDARFRFDGVDHRVPPRLGAHAIHGTCMDVGWTVEHASSDRVGLAVELAPAWPFRGRVRHLVELRPGRLRCTLEIRAGAEPMPASLGWHPWFRRRLDRGGPLEVELDAAGLWERAADGCPTGRQLPAPALAGRRWDDCFSGVRRAPVLRWPGALEVRALSLAPAWVLYDEEQHAACLEPQSAPPDALNQRPEACLVLPGQVRRLGFSLVWPAPPTEEGGPG